MILIFIYASTFGVSPVYASSSTETPKPQELTESNDLYFDAIHQSMKASYSYKTVEMGNIINADTTEPIINYPKYTFVTVPVEYGTVKLVEMLAEPLQMIKKGDPIAKITTTIDEIALEEQNLTLDRLQTSYQDYIREQTKALRLQKQSVDSISDELLKKIASLEYEKAIHDYEVNKKDMEKQVNSLKEQINESKSIKDATMIVAPCDGYLASTTSMMPGDKFDHTKSLAKIVDTSTIYLQVSDSQLKYQYNMKVIIDINPTESGSEKTLTGRVISTAIRVGSDGNIIGTCYIKPEEQLSFDDVKDKKLKVTIETCNMENVLVLPSDLVVIENRESFEKKLGVVYELKNDTLISRKFIAGLYNNSYCQVIAGLEEGTKIAKKQ